MANQISNRARQFPWVTPSGTTMGPAGLTAEEVKIQQGKGVAAPNVAPIAQRGPVDFISPSPSGEALRLAVPESANPFVTPTGPRHDHMMIRQAISRSRSDVSRALVQSLKEVPAGITPEAVGQMRASLARENAMLKKLHGLQQMQEEIYGRVIGGQEA